MEAQKVHTVLVALLIILIIGVAVVVTILAGAPALGGLAVILRGTRQLLVGVLPRPAARSRAGQSRERG